jgi:gluconate 2-dehydrogenase gamma chain
VASVASAFSGFARWSYAFPQDATQTMVQPAYRPQFFTSRGYATVELLVDLILPGMLNSAQTLQPGAKEAGVAEFIDFMVYRDASLQAPFEQGLRWLDRAAGPAAGFAALPVERQHALLERLAYKAKHRPQEAAGQAFFQLLRRYTVMGFYTTRIGLESLDYPGLKFYSTSPACTHHDNPEHMGL